MEQTLALATIDTQQLQKLPDVLTQNQSLAERASKACREAVDTIKQIAIESVETGLMEQHDQTLNGLQVKLKDAYTIMQERRKPFTKLFDEVKSKFTDEEKKIVLIGEEIKAIRDGWQREKAKRAKVEEERQQRELAKKNEAIELRQQIQSKVYDNFCKSLAVVFGKLNDAFNEQTTETFNEYELKLKKWTPVLDEKQWQGIVAIAGMTIIYVSAEEASLIASEETESMRGNLSNEWCVRLAKERDRLIELIPSRKRELERISGDEAARKEAEERMQREAVERKAQMEREAEERKADAELEAEVAKMNTAFDMAAEATPVVGITKGTVTKKKYVTNSHAAWVAIIQSFVTNDMNKMTLDEIGKKLSFMKTAAEKRLNEGVVLEAKGLEVEEDYSTRTTRKTA